MNFAKKTARLWKNEVLVVVADVDVDDDDDGDDNDDVHVADDDNDGDDDFSDEVDDVDQSCKTFAFFLNSFASPLQTSELESFSFTGD